MRVIAHLLTVAALAGSAAAFAASGRTKLIAAISRCDVDLTHQLLEAGAVNATDERREPITRWLASGTSGCTDARALEVAKLLDQNGARFDLSAGKSGPSLLTNLAPRRMPMTLAFLALKRGTGDPTEALRAVASRDDLASVRVLLEAGANPTEGVAMGSALMDAALAGRAGSVAEMMKHVKDKQSANVLAAYEAARRSAKGPTAQAFISGGMTPPTPPPLARSACEPRGLTTGESNLLARLGLVDGPRTCKFIQECGDVILIDCNSAADGPAYYVDRRTPQLLATCGGACMRGCTGCPPRAWTCACSR